MNKKILELRKVAKSYNEGGKKSEILKNLNLSIGEGESSSIIGSSGSGKSTLLHIAGLLDSFDSGEIIHYFKGKDGNFIKDANLIRRKYIGFVYQYHHLLKDFTALENVAMPGLIEGRDRKILFAEAEALLSAVGLGRKKNNVPAKLSGGERQRVAIARSLINRPKLILADEPTGNLDPVTSSEVFGLLLEIVKKEGAALIVATHNPALAARTSSIYELTGGTLSKRAIF